jgi:type III secretion system HrpE/YscL family protein
MARVIRGGGRVVPVAIVDARQQAARIVEEARAEATRLVSEAERGAAEVERRAAHQGEESALATLAARLFEAERRRDGALAEAERDLAKIALAAARRIVGEELTVAPERIVAIVREVLDRARRARRIVVRVHPEDAATLRRLAEGALPYAIEEDPAIARGGCVIETELGEVDARIETKLAALEKALQRG